MNFKKTIFISLAALAACSLFLYKLPLISRLISGINIYSQSKVNARYYQLKPSLSMEDVTSRLAKDTSIPEKYRRPLAERKRKIVIFKYNSHGQYIAGYLSYLVKGSHPSLIFFPGGNGWLGILRPANLFSYIPGYNTIGTLYRGNLYGGTDTFSGKDLEDTRSLIEFIPKLEKFTHKSLKPPYTTLGISRGATQMIASLAHLPDVRSKVSKVISVSGALDLKTEMRQRKEMHYLFEKKFKAQSEISDFNSWLSYRDPISLVSFLNPKTPLLIIYGDHDKEVSRKQQTQFIKAARKRNIPITYITIPGAGHSMKEKPLRLKKHISHFLMEPTPSSSRFIG